MEIESANTKFLFGLKKRVYLFHDWMPDEFARHLDDHHSRAADMLQPWCATTQRPRLWHRSFFMVLTSFCTQAGEHLQAWLSGFTCILLFYRFHYALFLLFSAKFLLFFKAGLGHEQSGDVLASTCMQCFKV